MSALDESFFSKQLKWGVVRPIYLQSGVFVLAHDEASMQEENISLSGSSYYRPSLSTD